MKVCAISDMHGQYDFTVPECDILCISGDIVPLEIQRPPRTKPVSFETQGLSESDIEFYMMYNKSLEEQYEKWRLKNICWIDDIFIPWCESQPVKKIFLVAGNHDFFFETEGKENIKKIFEDTNIVYLEDEFVEFEGKKIYGSPWCHQFGPWAFMRNDYSLASKFKKIPDGIDILLTHDAPYGRTDLLLESEMHLSKGHIGNKPLLNRLKKLKEPPKIHFTGHLHSCNHVPEDFDGTTTVCVSLLDEDYFMNYKPFLISID